MGIGASAGGLEALQEFFSHLPDNTGAAFVVVQHLSPDFKSMMPQLLSKHTQMPVHQAEDGITLERNNIYLMPARKNMLIGEDKLLLSEQMPDSHVPMPIDVFLRSLAEDKQERAIGIVLSGTGSDGTRGIKAMKESGGLVIVQEPDSAKFNGMPISAYNTGLADMVLRPSAMGEKLQNYINHTAATDNAELKSVINENDTVLEEIFKLLIRQSSINFNHYKASTVARRIERRMSINQIIGLDGYLKLLLDSPRELQILSKELLIGVTRFFRDDDSFSLLSNKIIPKVVSKAMSQNRPIRVWVAGCSSGEEAYSMAILFDEYLTSENLKCEVKIFATDVDDEAISEASSCNYSLDILQDIAADRIERYFIREENRFHLEPDIRKNVIFASHNLIEDPPFSNIDIVTCRNVLIYFQHAAQKKVLSSLTAVP